MGMITTEDELIKKCVELVNGPPLPVLGKGDKRFGMTLENYMGIDINSRRTSDIECLNLELKAKVNSDTDLTLFSTTPHFLRTNSEDFFRVHGKEKENAVMLNTDISTTENSFGLKLLVINNDGDREMVIHDVARNMNRASISLGHIKHLFQIKFKNLLLAYGESSIINEVECVRFDKIHIYNSLIINNALIEKLLINNEMIYSFRKRERNGKKKDRGAAFRIKDPKYLGQLYADYRIIERK